MSRNLRRTESNRPRAHMCNACCNQAWRRARPRCFGCQRAYAPEQVQPAEQRCSSAIAECEES